MSARHRTILQIVATDSTFELVRDDGERAWRGKCLHCRRALWIDVDGTPISEATIEHIQPRNHGGSDELRNLALACARCNHQKGVRHDNKRAQDPRRLELVELLRLERERRWRDPD